MTAPNLALDVRKIISVGEAVGIPTREAASALRREGLSHQEALMAGLQFGSIALRGLNHQHLTIREAQECLRRCHAQFQTLDGPTVRNWLVRMRNESDFCVERDFASVCERAGDHFLAKQFLGLLHAKLGDNAPQELEEIRRVLDPSGVAATAK